MKPFTKILLTISLLGFLLGLLDTGNAMFSGMARAVGAVFFILTFISRVSEKAVEEEPCKS